MTTFAPTREFKIAPGAARTGPKGEVFTGVCRSEVHDHGWVVDVATGRVQRGSCPGGAASNLDPLRSQ